MIFRVKYLDKDAIEKDYSLIVASSQIGNINHIIPPTDQSWSHYFGIDKDIESDDYSIVYYDGNTFKMFDDPKLWSQFLIIEVKGEMMYVDMFKMKNIWSHLFHIETNLRGSYTFNSDNFLKIFDRIIRTPKKYNDYFYSWDSVMDRYKCLNIPPHKEWVDIDRIIKRDSKINNILNNG